MDKIFVDSDIIIDFFANREPFANAAAVIFDLGSKGKIKIYVSAMSICNIYYLLRKEIGHKSAIKVIDLLIDLVDVISTTKTHIKESINSNFKDFEDGVQHFSALELKGMSAILTRNLKDYKNSKIAVFTAENYVKLVAN